jgi:hypothetical protein
LVSEKSEDVFIFAKQKASNCLTEHFLSLLQAQRIVVSLQTCNLLESARQRGSVLLFQQRNSLMRIERNVAQ